MIQQGLAGHVPHDDRSCHAVQLDENVVERDRSHSLRRRSLRDPSVNHGNQSQVGHKGNGPFKTRTAIKRPTLGTIRIRLR